MGALPSPTAGTMQRPPPGTWSLRAVLQLVALLAVCILAASLLSEAVWHPEMLGFVHAFGVIALWRYAWWACHWLRAAIFARIVYPPMRERAAALWQSGWRPRHIHVLLTTFHEQTETSRAVIDALCREIRDAGVPATLWLGSSNPRDEDEIIRHLQRFAGDLDVTLRIIRQNQPGKRVAIALLLRAMSRAGLGRSEDDIVVLMDGDFIVHEGVIRRCFPLLMLDRGLHALTTDEHARVVGPRWLQSWLDMRFAQRRLAMQSHALSGRVLTLTGRFSVFRTTHIVSEEFIRLLEADCLDHWLWGRFRFLSGDDKSTWFCLLKRGARMTYVPDAGGTTIEVVEGSGSRRLAESLMRWSGNMLRNGARAIGLGPRRMPVFIWWCLVDQRIAMWTALIGPLAAVAGAVTFGAEVLWAYLAYVFVTRLVVALVLFAHAPRVDFNFVWTLYASQILNAAIKIYLLWRLPRQRWANRGDQRAQVRAGASLVWREVMAAYLTVLSFSALTLGVLVYSGAAGVPAAGINLWGW